MSPTPTAVKAVTVKKTFSRETSVRIDINASPAAIWEKLTNGSAVPQWNSTVVSLEGEIAMGSTIRLVSTLDPKRTFKLKVKSFVPNAELSWGDAMGSRVYSLTPGANGFTTFEMREKIGGPVFPLFARMIPSFDASFEQTAADLKKAVEQRP